MITYKLCKCGKRIETHIRKCEECNKAYKKTINKNYDLFKRNKESTKFYNSSEWRKLRTIFINKNPFCFNCGKLAKIVDHIIPIKQGGDRLNQDNLQSLCIKCHNEKTKKELRG